MMYPLSWKGGREELACEFMKGFYAGAGVVNFDCNPQDHDFYSYGNELHDGGRPAVLAVLEQLEAEDPPDTGDDA